MKAYRTMVGGFSIQEVEIERMTSSYVWLQTGRKTLKDGDYFQYFESFRVAQLYLIRKAQANIRYCTREIESLNSSIKNNLDELQRLYETLKPVETP